MQLKTSLNLILADLGTKKKIRKNQQDVIKLINETKGPVVINSKVLVKGSIEHYYHFIHDLVFPLSIVLSNISSKKRIFIHDFGPLTERLLEIFWPQLQVIDTPSPTPVVELLGMDAIALETLHFTYRGVRKFIFQKFNVDRHVKPNKIILIERIKPHAYYMTEAKAKNGGSYRREIKNHHTLVGMLSQITSAPFQFQNVILEHQTLKEQVKLFHSSAIVIAQHGAGLANIVWMQKNTVVIEFGHHDLTYFKKLSTARKVRYHVYKNFTSRKIQIDLDDFQEWLVQQSTLRGAFSER